MKEAPGPTATWVSPATPSSAPGTRTPCQCKVVATGSWLIRVTRTRSPWRTRSAGPGTVPLKVSAGCPSMIAVCAVRMKEATGCGPGGSVSAVTGVPVGSVAGAATE